MFALGGDSFPTSHDQFIDALRDGLRIFGAVPGIKELTIGAFPDIKRLEVDLTGGMINQQARPSARAGATKPGLRIQTLSVYADPLCLPGAQVSLHLDANNVALDFARNEEGRPILTITFAESGRISASASTSDIESLALAIARNAAVKHDVTVENIAISLTSRSPRDIAFEAEISAQKMIFSVKVNATGRIHLDDQLTAHITDLDCTGEGMVNAGAAQILRPQLEKINGKSYPLSALPLGNVRIHDVELHTGEPIKLEAKFGKA